MFGNKPYPYVIAELCANHNGNLDNAVRLIDEAVGAGCDCVKFQSWDRDLFADEVYERNRFLEDGREIDGNLEELVDKYAVSADDLAYLSSYCRKVGVDFASSVFTSEQINELVNLSPAFIKVASMDLNNDHIIQTVADTGLPALVSTGLSDLEEIAHAVACFEKAGNKNLCLMHCKSVYPPKDDEIDLLNIELLRDSFGYPVGFSDHSIGSDVAIAAFTLGISAYEKHFTLDKNMEGWDHKISADPTEMKQLVGSAKRVTLALGSAKRRVYDDELAMRKAFRRSLFAARDIQEGEIFSEDMIVMKRPGNGLNPNRMNEFIGRVARQNIKKDKMLSGDDLSGGLGFC